MQEVVEINLVQLLKLDLNVNEYLTLLKLDMLSKDESLAFSSSEKFLESLVSKGYLNNDNGEISFTSKGSKVFNKVERGITDKEFDELFFLYPEKTPDGRSLRAKGKEINGKITRDYSVILQKYKTKVKSTEEHEAVMKATKAFISDYKRRGASQFMNKFEVYVNQSMWERFMDIDPLELYGENVERL